MKAIPTILLEESLWSQGLIHVCGIDEAGRGPLAGPVTAGAVMIHNKDQIIPSVRDSKLMTARNREKTYMQIMEKSSAFGVGIVSSEEIDIIGINKAVQKAMMQALDEIEINFKIKIDYVIVDGSKTLTLPKYKSQKIKAGDLHHYTISAGSVLAKVARDRIMKEEAKKYPEYGFETHVGYGTKKHLAALKKHGICPLHRKSYQPIKNLKLS